jgi:putative transposase
MGIYRKTYRFRGRPTRTQKQALDRNVGVRRFIWNWGLARKREYYQATGKTLHYIDLNRELTELKRQPGFEWLCEIDLQLLQEALRDLDQTFVGFPKKRTKLSRFKSRKRDRVELCE